jgi:hypothetical protein
VLRVPSRVTGVALHCDSITPTRTVSRCDQTAGTAIASPKRELVRPEKDNAPVTGDGGVTLLRD